MVPPNEVQKARIPRTIPVQPSCVGDLFHGNMVIQFFSASLPERMKNAEQPSSSMVLFSLGETCACTFFQGEQVTLTTPVPQNLGLLMKTTTSKRNLPCFSHLGFNNKKTIQTTRAPPWLDPVDPSQQGAPNLGLRCFEITQFSRNIEITHQPRYTLRLMDGFVVRCCFLVGWWVPTWIYIYIIFPGKEFISPPWEKGTYHLQMWLLMFAPRRVCHRFRYKRNIVCGSSEMFWRGATCVKNVSIGVSILRGGQLKQIHDEWLITWSCHHHHLAKTDDIHETRSLAKVFG